MSAPDKQPSDPRAWVSATTRVRVAYDRIAAAYDDAIGGELAGKPVDRALLAAFVELCGAGIVADVGCGPGHVTRFLERLTPNVLGVDLSAGMLRRALSHDASGAYMQASMLDLPVPDGSWSGATLLYSIIHLSAEERACAMQELARAIESEGWLLVAFHIDSPAFAAGGVNHITEWFGHEVNLEGYFLEPGLVVHDVEEAGFKTVVTTVRKPWPSVEHPSRRCYLFAQRSMQSPSCDCP